MIVDIKELDNKLLLKDLKNYCIDCSGNKEDRVINCSLNTCRIHKWRKYFIDLDKVVKVEKVETNKEELSKETKEKLTKKIKNTKKK